MSRQTSYPRRNKSLSTALPSLRRRLIVSIALLGVLLMGTTAFASIGFIMKWGTTGSGNGDFLTPRGMATDAAGNVYVADAGNNRVQKFDNNGNFSLKFGIPGDVNGGFVTTSGVAVAAGGDIYVSDDFTQRISIFNSLGVFQSTFSAGAFPTVATGVALDSSGNVYVTDSGNHRVRKFTATGTLITSWGSSGTGDGMFNGPQGLAIDSSNNVYVADTGNNRIQKFNSSGGFITKWGTPGSGNSEFNSPTGVSADSSGTIYVADSGNSRIQSFSATGTFIEAFGLPGSGDGQFASPQDLAADAFGNIFVADSGNDRVQKLGAAVSVVADAGADQTVECAGATTSVTLNGGASTGSGTLSYTWKEGATVLGSGSPLMVSLPLGPHSITLTVTSSGGGSDDDEVLVTIVDTEAPTITLNGADPMIVECHTTFVDPGATANDGCAGSFAATPSGSVNANVPGNYVIAYDASDPSGNAATTKTRTVQVVDTTVPIITLNGQTPSMWSPNHKYQTFQVTDFVTGVTDSCSTTLGIDSVVISQVTSDELENSGGDGNTLNDIVIASDCKSVQLRAERAGGGDGRVYTITFRVTDSSGNATTATARVVVPKSQGSGSAIDSGVHYIVNGGCP